MKNVYIRPNIMLAMNADYNRFQCLGPFKLNIVISFLIYIYIYIFHFGAIIYDLDQLKYNFKHIHNYT